MRKTRTRRVRKSAGGGSTGGEWLTTYSDMVTLLLTFFVILFSISSVNPVKWDQLIQTYGNQKKSVTVTEEPKLTVESIPEELYDEELPEEDITVNYDDIQRFLRYIENPDAFDISDIKDEASFDDFYEIMNQYILNNDLTEHVGLDRDENFVMIRFKDKAFFDSGRAALKSESVFIIRSVTALLNLVNDQVDQIKVTGYTDSVPHNGEWGIADNLELSCQRARNMVMFLKEYGIDSSKVYTIGRAEEDPIASNDTAEGRALNRRVEIIATRKELPRATEENLPLIEEIEETEETEEPPEVEEIEGDGRIEDTDATEETAGTEAAESDSGDSDWDFSAPFQLGEE